VTLHYHAWAFELAQAVCRAGALAADAERLLVHYLTDWLERCDISRPGAEYLAWNPYAIATRLGWWSRAFRLLGKSFFAAHPNLAETLLSSMWRQAHYLEQNLEWDLRANHLLRDAVGLAWAGRVFRGQVPERWLRTATQVARQQAGEQVLPDGGHFERSPHYHLEVMDDWATLAQLLDDREAMAIAREAWCRMADYAAWLCHADGAVPQLNDAPCRAVQPHLDAGQHLGVPVPAHPHHGGRHFADSGLSVWHGQPWTVFFDVGEVGPDYQPGHAHADTLTLETSLAGQRLFIDPGCYSYDDDARRRYDRSTAAHNTVCIDEVDSSEVWHIFRVGRRARPQDVVVDVRRGGLRAAAAHDGYGHLPGHPRHRRSLSVSDACPLEVVDQIDGHGEHRLSGGFLLAPSWKATAVPGGWRLVGEQRRLAVHVTCDRPVRLELEGRLWHSDFGVELETQRLAWRYEGRLPFELTVRVEAD
jgi:uncharacterized heparinase superfamily protein